MQFKRAGQAAFAQQALLISRASSWGDFADKMHEKVEADMSDGEAPFTLADYSAPTEPDHSAFWEYIDEHIEDLSTDRSKCIENYSTLPMGSI